MRILSVDQSTATVIYWELLASDLEPAIRPILTHGKQVIQVFQAWMI